VPDKVRYTAVDGHHPAEETLSFAPIEGSPIPNRPTSTRAAVPGQHPTFSKIEFDGGVPSPVKYHAVNGHHPAESSLDLRGLEGSPLPQQPNSARGPMPKPTMGESEEAKYSALAKAHPSHSNLTLGGDDKPVQPAASPRGGPTGVHVSQSNFQLGSGPDAT